MTTRTATKATSKAVRMSADERRLLVLDGATRAFARTGFHGTSTDAVAREAGVSQPYVVRLFGTKRDLFLEVLARACDRVGQAFASVIASGPFDPGSDDDWGRLGEAYFELLHDRDLLLVMMHGFSAGDDEDIARCSREGFDRIAVVLTDAGCDPGRIQEFFAHGMLLNVLVSMRTPEHDGEQGTLALISECAFGEKGKAAW